MTGVRTEGWPEARWPTIDELDRATTGLPCVLMSFDHHAAACNSAALAHAGLKGGDRVAELGVVVADEISGLATGFLLEHAAYCVWGCAPEPTEQERVHHVWMALERLRALGFTEAHDLHSQGWLGPALNTLEREDRLAINVWLYPPIAGLERDHAGRSAWVSEKIRLAGGKVFADGTLNSRTAFVLDEYREPRPGPGGGAHGKAMVSAAELDRAIELVERLGVHLAVHAIGDACVRMALDAIERTSKTPIGSRGMHRIEHCELVHEDDLSRFAEMDVVCSVQPCHLLTDIEVLCRQLPHCLDRVLPLRSLINAGCAPGELLWFGSDAPIVRPEPEDSMQAAVHRRRVGMMVEESIGFEQRLTVEEVDRCFSRAGLP
jgi:predicted amidohydrolase YtcJ